MRVLLDECVNPRVKSAFPDHEVQTVQGMGWGGITNGKLVDLAQQSFDVFVTVDQNLEHQQNLAKFTLGLVIGPCRTTTSSSSSRSFLTCAKQWSRLDPVESSTSFTRNLNSNLSLRPRPVSGFARSRKIVTALKLSKTRTPFGRRAAERNEARSVAKVRL